MGKLGTQCRLSTAFHPQTDGQTERYNRTLEEVLRHFISPDMTNWAKLLPMVEFALNSYVHESTRQTPFFLTYGRHPPSPLDLTFQVTQQEGYAEGQTLQDAWRETRRLLQEANVKMKARADKARSDFAFQEEESVWLSTRNFSWNYGARKLCPKWVGPFKILNPCGSVAYRLDLPTEWKIHPVFHVSLLKPYRPDTRYKAPTPSSVRDGIPQWELDQILKHRQKGTAQGKEYLVAWKGFGPEYHSWMSEAALQDAKTLLSTYWRSVNMHPDVGTVNQSSD